MIVEEEDKEGLYTRVEKKQRVRKLIRKNPRQNPVNPDSFGLKETMKKMN